MGGNTGNIRTLRSQSGTNGVRTWQSILSSDANSGAGSVRRLYGYYARNGQQNQFFQLAANIHRPQNQARTNWFLSTVVFPPN